MRGQPILVKQLLQKAKDSALLAVEYYNKPAISFKSEGFIVMICIAWTSFFHAYFLKNKIKPFYRKKSIGKRLRYEIVVEKLSNGVQIENKKWWDLNKCMEEFFKINPDVGAQKNVEFLSGLRNLIVHRNLPELDASIYGECQASIINLNNYLEKYFGEKYKLDVFLSFSIQLFASPKNFLEASKNELVKKGAVEIVEYIKAFRSTLTTQILETPEYSFKAILIRVKNHESKDAIPIKFINESDLTEEQKKIIKNTAVCLVKEKKVDGIPENYISWGELKSELKRTVPELKLNKEFNEIKTKLICNNPNLLYIRRLDPNNLKSSAKIFFHKNLVEEIKKYYFNNKSV